MAGVGELEVEAEPRDAVGWVCDVHERMFTWCSDSTSATSRSSRDRSSASISTDTTYVAGRVVVPLDLDDAVGLAARGSTGVGAVGAVHRHAAARRDEAHDLVARHRACSTATAAP